MKAFLTLEVDYDPEVTDPEALANACDRLWKTALSRPDILDEFGNPRFGEFLVSEPLPQQFVIEVQRGRVSAVYSNDLSAEAILIDWDVDGVEEQRLVEVARPDSPPIRAAVSTYPVSLMGELIESDTETVIREAGLGAVIDATMPLSKRSLCFLLYDFDADELASTRVYYDRQTAAEDAEALDNVHVVALPTVERD